MPVKAIPDGYHTVTPYLMSTDAHRLVEFIVRAFGAEEMHRTSLPDGSIMHTQVRIGDSIVMVSDTMGRAEPSRSTLYVYVPDVDATYKQALAAGGTSIMEPMNAFYGDRSGGVQDPSGNAWWIATHVEDVAPDELARRAEAAVKEQTGAS